jgi:hypothetical protein
MLNVKLYLILDELNNKVSLWCVYPNGVRQCVVHFKGE